MATSVEFFSYETKTCFFSVNEGMLNTVTVRNNEKI